MGKVLWHTPLSLDGFIAGPDDDMGWVFDVDGGSGQTADDVVRSTGALLVGRVRRMSRIACKRASTEAPFAGRSLCCAIIRRRSLLS
jgi:hypothetical protein